MRWCLLFLLFASVSCVHRTDPFSHSVTTAEKPWTHESFKNDPEEFQFAVLTDRTGGMRPGVFASAVTKMNAVQPEFVVSVGDYIEGYKTDRAALNAEWEEMDRITAGFEMPFFFLPGNHDITNPTMKKMYEDRLGHRYYAFVYKDVLFVCLDTQDQPVKTGSHVIQDAGLLPEQVEWARGVLQEHAEVRWTFVLMHQPLWLYETSRASADSRHPVTGRITGWSDIQAALGDRDFTVFAGHLHRYTKYVRQEKDFYVLATTGGGSRLRGTAYGEFDHAVWITMTRNGPKVANLMLDGIVGDDVYTEHTATFRESVKLDYAVDLPRRTITGSLHIHNPFGHPLTVAETWTDADLPGWQIHSTIDGDPIQPGGEKTYAVELQYEPGTDLARFPELSLECAAGSELNGVFPQGTPQRALLAAARPRQAVGRLDRAPTVDGTLEDAEWSGAAIIPRLMKLESMNPSEDEATVWVAYDSEAFYLAGQFTQDPEALRLESTQPDHPLWDDDSIEIFFDVNLDEKTYAQAIVTANNVSKKFLDLGAIETATGRTADAWTVEVKVPWKALSHPSPALNDSIGFNVRRNRATDGPRRVSEWTPTLLGHPHSPGLFGILELR